jgi:hypothetical protein
MKVAITGASGLIGSALSASLSADGHHVLALVRRPARGANEVSWDPVMGTVDTDGLAGVEAVVHLAASSVGGRGWNEMFRPWTPKFKQQVLDSRVLGTTTIAQAVASLDPHPVLVSGSAIGYYGETGDRSVTEDAPAAEDFFAEVCREWEAATHPAVDAGVRVPIARSGIVVSRSGGAFGPLWLQFKLGLGGRIGPGTQWWSWVSLRDEVRALRFLIDDAGAAGPYNVTSPNPATNAQITQAMGQALHRPTMLPVPTAAMNAALGELAQSVVGSIRVIPHRLQEAGFEFLDATIDDALRTALGRAS